MDIARASPVAVVFLACCLQAPARPVVFGGMAADLPEGWTVLEAGERSFAAASNGLPQGAAIFQATWFETTTFPGALESLETLRAGLDAQGEAVVFSLDGETAALAEIRFRAGQASARGYLLTMDTPARDIALLAYADDAGFAVASDFLLSALDSFRVSEGEASRPGPISQFLTPYPSRGAEVRSVPFRGADVPVRYDSGELEALQTMIEREARILVRYATHPGRDEAWRRYYRLIYRDSRPRLQPVAAAIDRLSGGHGTADAKEAQAILTWLQGFAYERTGSLSDLLSPLSSVIRGAGDCDARALALVIILSHLGADGVLLVSSVYSHAVAAVAVDAPGLGLMLDGRKYVLAETTKRVPLGWLSDEQQNLSNWVVVRFDG